MPFPRLLYSFLVSILFAGTVPGQTDDFNDGDDAGWTRLDSLGIILGSPFASFEFPDGGYRVRATDSPAPSLIGPSRAASLRQDVTYNNRVFISVDLKISDPSIQQAVGVLAFVQPNPAPGAVSGYSLSYQPLTGDIVLNRIVNEAPIELAYSDLNAPAGTSLRLVLIIEDEQFWGAVYNLDDLVNPIAKVAATDWTFTSGTAGVFVFSDTDDRSGPVDATFDNYRANPVSLPELQLTLQGETGYQLTWPDWAVHFSPTFSTTLGPEPWERIPNSELQTGGGSLFHIGERGLDPKKFFRLERRPP
jgi:hypothetical protein